MNINFLILHYDYIHLWESIIKKTLDLDIKLLKENINKNINYNIMKLKYKVPKLVIDYVKNSFYFKYFNDYDKQIKYTEFWEQNVQTTLNYSKIPDDFNPTIYTLLNKDLICKNDFELKMHWSLFGEVENRNYKL